MKKLRFSKLVLFASCMALAFACGEADFYESNLATNSSENKNSDIDQNSDVLSNDANSDVVISAGGTSTGIASTAVTSTGNSEDLSLYIRYDFSGNTNSNDNAVLNVGTLTSILNECRDGTAVGTPTVTATNNVFSSNPDVQNSGGDLKGTGFLKFASAKIEGAITLSFAVNIQKVVISTRAWNTDKTTYVVLNDDLENRQANGSGAYKEITFDDISSNTITISSADEENSASVIGRFFTNYIEFYY